MGTVILIGVLADQQLVRLRQGRADRAKESLRATTAPSREVSRSRARNALGAIETKKRVRQAPDKTDVVCGR